MAVLKATGGVGGVDGNSGLKCECQYVFTILSNQLCSTVVVAVFDGIQ